MRRARWNGATRFTARTSAKPCELSSSAQLTRHYKPRDLEGLLIVAVVNFPPRQIGPFQSQVLTLGVPDADGGVVLLVPDKKVPIGGRLF